MFTEQTRNCTQQLVNIPDEAIIAINENHRIVFINRYGSKLFDMEEGEALGRPIQNIIPLNEVEFNWIDIFAQIQLYGKWQGESEPIFEGKESIRLDIVAFAIESDNDSKIVFVAKKWTQWEKIRVDLKETWENVTLLAELFIFPPGWQNFPWRERLLLLDRQESIFRRIPSFLTSRGDWGGRFFSVG